MGGAVARKIFGILGRYVLVWLVTGLALLLVTSILPGFRIDTSDPDWWKSLLRLPLIFTVLMILLRPLLLFLTLPLNVVTIGFPTLLFNGLILYLSAMFEHPFQITNYGEALVGTLVMTAITARSPAGWAWMRPILSINRSSTGSRAVIGPRNASANPCAVFCCFRPTGSRCPA